MEQNRNDQAGDQQHGDLNRGRSSSKLSLPKIVLASASPRRAEILRTACWDFEVVTAGIDETCHAGEGAIDYVERIAREKAEVVQSQLKDGTPVVGADTIVVVDKEILGKPRHPEDARRMLRLLQERWHQVLTGVAVLNGNSSHAVLAHEVTDVKFAPMTEDEIEWYVASGEPMDKAGAYAIQGLGARFIEAIRGDYLNVVGLPLRLLYGLLKDSD